MNKFDIEYSVSGRKQQMQLPAIPEISFWYLMEDKNQEKGFVIEMLGQYS